jgi:hypothetical protein
MYIQTVIEKEEKNGNAYYVLYHIDEMLFQSTNLQEVEEVQKKFAENNSSDEGFYKRRS